MTLLFLPLLNGHQIILYKRKRSVKEAAVVASAVRATSAQLGFGCLETRLCARAVLALVNGAQLERHMYPSVAYDYAVFALADFVT